MKRFLLGYLILSLAILLFIVVPAEAGSERSVVRDNFNRYTNGSIVGQGGWSNRSNGENFQVQNLVTFEGRKALHINSLGDSVITKFGRSLSDGRQTVLIRTENQSSWGGSVDGNAQVRVSKGPWAEGAPNLPFVSVSFKRDGNVAYYDPVSGVYQNFGTYIDNEWTKLVIQWRSSDKKARYRVNNGGWTNWYTFQYADNFTDFDHVGFDFYNTGSGGVDFDTLR